MLKPQTQVHFHPYKYIDKERNQREMLHTMAPKRHSVGGNVEHTEQENNYQTMNLTYYDSWKWCKRNRSSEVTLTDTFRKGIMLTS